MGDVRGPKNVGINKYTAVKIIHDVHKLKRILCQKEGLLLINVSIILIALIAEIINFGERNQALQGF